MVATSPLVASLALGFGKYSIFTRRTPCAPQLSFILPRRPGWPPARDRPPAASPSCLSSSTITRRSRLPRQSTCFSTPVATPEGVAPDRHGTAFSSFGDLAPCLCWRGPPARATQRAPAALIGRVSRASSSILRFFSASSQSRRCASTSSRLRSMRARSPGVAAACSPDLKACAAFG